MARARSIARRNTSPARNNFSATARATARSGESCASRRSRKPIATRGRRRRSRAVRRSQMQEALNHAKLAMLFRKEFELCNVRKGETIVLLSDLGARRDYVAAAFAAAEDFGADAYEMCV